MSSADPSLSLPHQSHTVPPAHPVPSLLPLIIVLYPRSPRSPLSSPLSSRGPTVAHPTELFSLPRRVTSTRSDCAIHPLRYSSPPPASPAIDINLRNFFFPGVHMSPRYSVSPTEACPMRRARAYVRYMYVGIWSRV